MGPLNMKTFGQQDSFHMQQEQGDITRYIKQSLCLLGIPPHSYRHHHPFNFFPKSLWHELIMSLQTNANSFYCVLSCSDKCLGMLAELFDSLEIRMPLPKLDSCGLLYP